MGYLKALDTSQQLLQVSKEWTYKLASQRVALTLNLVSSEPCKGQYNSIANESTGTRTSVLACWREESCRESIRSSKIKKMKVSKSSPQLSQRWQRKVFPFVKHAILFKTYCIKLHTICHNPDLSDHDLILLACTCLCWSLSCSNYEELWL